MQTKTIKIRNIKGRVEDNILSKTGMAVSVSHGMAGISRQMAYTYDAIGRLTGKRRQLTGTGVSTCQYAYDVHGWPRSVKEGEFRQQLYYADGLDGGCWNGNISTVKWKTDGNSSWQGYNLRYDGAGRLQGAVFGSGDNLTSYRGYFSESAEYDSGGNVTGLRRRGLTDNLHGGFSYVDRLCMTYEGNRLVSVRDSASRLPYANATDFGGVTGREYALAYNGAGALVSDEGRGMARVDYDLMGNPARIQFTDGSVTRYIYSATGEKLRVFHLTAVPNITVAMGQTRELVPSEILSADSTDYLLGGTLTMRDGRIDRYLFDEGYCQAMPSAINASQDYFTFYYFDRDHLGSVRQVILANGTNKGTLVQKMDYYPSGLRFCDGNSDGDVQPVRFSGKELDRMHGLGTYDFGARQYNPVTMRWDRMDPLCEKYYSISPYTYCGGDPVNRYDDGRDWYQNLNTQYFTWFENQNGDIDGYNHIGGKGSVLGEFEGIIDYVLTNGFEIESLYSNGFTFDISPNDKGALIGSKERDWDFTDEFIHGTGPEFSVLLDNHPYTEEMKTDDAVLKAQYQLLYGHTDVKGQITNYPSNWTPLDALTTFSLPKQFIGSYRYDGFMSKDGKCIYNIISDSKSAYSALYHLTSDEHRRSKSKEFGTTYQFYIWQTKIK